MLQHTALPERQQAPTHSLFHTRTHTNTHRHTYARTHTHTQTQAHKHTHTHRRKILVEIHGREGVLASSCVEVCVAVCCSVCCSVLQCVWAPSTPVCSCLVIGTGDLRSKKQRRETGTTATAHQPGQIISQQTCTTRWSAPIIVLLSVLQSAVNCAQ